MKSMKAMKGQKCAPGETFMLFMPFMVQT